MLTLRSMKRTLESQGIFGLKIDMKNFSILGLHPRDETAMLVYKTIENGPTSFA